MHTGNGLTKCQRKSNPRTDAKLLRRPPLGQSCKVLLKTETSFRVGGKKWVTTRGKNLVPVRFLFILPTGEEV